MDLSIDYINKIKNDLKGWLYMVKFKNGDKYRTYKLDEALNLYFNDERTERFYIYQHELINKYCLVMCKN